MKTDKKQLMQAIEAIKAKLAVMEEQLNKPDEFKHFPSKGEEYHYYISTGVLCSNTAADYELRVNVYRTEKEADRAYNKAVAVEKIKRRIVELQGDWKDDKEVKFCIQYDHYETMFIPDCWFIVQPDTTIPYMKSKEIVLTIIKEMEDELKLLFDIA